MVEKVLSNLYRAGESKENQGFLRLQKIVILQIFDDCKL